jgi:hypothetical protein
LVAEISVDQLCGDFRKPSQAVGVMEVHFTIYQNKDGTPGRVVLDKVFAQETPLTQRTPSALMAAWDNDLRQILEAVSSDYAKANLNDSGR